MPLTVQDTITARTNEVVAAAAHKVVDAVHMGETLSPSCSPTYTSAHGPALDSATVFSDAEHRFQFDKAHEEAVQQVTSVLEAGAWEAAHPVCC